MPELKEIRPQRGFQEAFLSSPADIAIGGGAAGAGKTYGLLMEPLYHHENPDFGAVIFRRTYPQIKSEGGLWDTSVPLYSIVGASPKESDLVWKFKSGAKLKFSHLEYEKNVLDWQGSQIPLLGFDELTHFSDKQFFYLLSRNRSTCGVKPYVRATCNPDPDSWVADFIEWWIEQDPNNENYGFPIPDRAGKLRYFLKDSDNYVWGNSKKEVIETAEHLIKPIIEASPETKPEDLIKSVTFIPGSIYENAELLKKDPGYLGNLMAQDEQTKLQLLKGNWKVRIGGDEIINYVKLMDAFSNEHVPTGKRAITADIALEGSDLFIIGVWEGWRLIDIFIYPKTKGPDIIQHLKSAARQYHVPQSRIVYDDDGVGAFIDGFLENPLSFNGGSKARKGEKFQNLRSQCYYKIADRINNQDGLYISPQVASKAHDRKSVKEHLISERRAIKRNKPDHEGKYSIIPKHEMITIIGHSPDFWDMVMMREYLDITSPATDRSMTKKDLGFF